MDTNKLNAVLAHRSGFFADRKTMEEAVEYAYAIAKSSESPPHVLAAVYVVLNTALKLVAEATQTEGETK
jgi:hypothetical protein